VLTALYETDTPFEYRKLESDEAMAELAALWPLRKMPVLVDDGRTVVEASVIVEHLQVRYPGPVRLIPAAPSLALEVRKMDRFRDKK